MEQFAWSKAEGDREISIENQPNFETSGYNKIVKLTFTKHRL